MTELLSIRVNGTTKSSLNLSSNLTEMPISKVLGPFLEESARIALGSAVMFQIDRAGIFQRERFERFVTLLLEPKISGSSLMADLGMEDIRAYSPQIIWDFLELITEEEEKGDFSSIFENIELSSGFFISTPFLRSITYDLGSVYIASGVGLDKLDYGTATREFFHLMMKHYYRYNARGTAKAINSQWYTHQKDVRRVEAELLDRYLQRTKKRVVQAIVVTEKSRKGVRKAAKQKVVKKKASAPG